MLVQFITLTPAFLYALINGPAPSLTPPKYLTTTNNLLFKLNDKIFVADVYDRDTNIGYIYFKLITYDNNIYAEEVLSKIIFPISSEIYRASLYELVNGTKYQFYVNTN